MTTAGQGTQGTRAQGNRGEGGVAVVTGGTGALGSAVAQRLAAEGYKVAIVDAPRPGGDDRGARIASELGARARAYGADVSTAEGWAALLPKIEADLGTPSHAVLVAGAWRGGKSFHEEDDGVWNTMMAANLETVHRSLRALLPGMVARGRGSIVVIGSRAAERPWTSVHAAAYAASKSAVVALAEAVAAEVLASHVRINAILPSTLDTPANRQAMPKADASKWVSTDSAAEVVAFLLSDAARDVSGAAIPVYGRS
jgi:NAD(P)-dependent dehydrogenase (short-subunit alcohol dehydrogenase family)